MDSLTFEIVNSAASLEYVNEPVLMFQIVVSSFVDELNHQVCSVPSAGSAGQVPFKGLHAVKVWAAVEPARAARAAMVKKFLIVGGREVSKDIRRSHQDYTFPLKYCC